MISNHRKGPGVLLQHRLSKGITVGYYLAVTFTSALHSESGSTLLITLVTPTINLKYARLVRLRSLRKSKGCTAPPQDTNSQMPRLQAEGVQCKYHASPAPVHFSENGCLRNCTFNYHNFQLWQTWFETDIVPVENYFLSYEHWWTSVVNRLAH